MVCTICGHYGQQKRKGLETRCQRQANKQRGTLKHFAAEVHPKSRVRLCRRGRVPDEWFMADAKQVTADVPQGPAPSAEPRDQVAHTGEELGGASDDMEEVEKLEAEAAAIQESMWDEECRQGLCFDDVAAEAAQEKQ